MRHGVSRHTNTNAEVTMQLSDFSAIYGFNERRVYLIGLLRDELDAICVKGWQVRCYIFGSFVREPLKELPGDLDAMFSISKPCEAEIMWKPLVETDDLHIVRNVLTADFSAPYELRPCNTVTQMIALFNDACEQAGEEVRIDGDGSDLVEVWL